MTSVKAIHPVPTKQADEDLAGWFRAARQAGRLPRQPFALVQAQTVSDPEQLYRWIEERLAGSQGVAIVSEAERIIRQLQRVVQEGS